MVGVVRGMTTLDERCEVLEADLKRFADQPTLRVKRSTLRMLLDERMTHVCVCGSRFRHPGELEGHKIKCGNWLSAVDSPPHDAAIGLR